MLTYRIEAACGCNTGRARQNNEDNFYFNGYCLPADNDGLESPMTISIVSGEKAVCMAVFDGMGGENYGELASFTSAKRMLDELNENRRVKADEHSLLTLSQKLNDAVVEKRQELLTKRMGTTVVMFAFQADKVLTSNLGDSRAYRIRARELKLLSVDHVEKRRGPSKKAPLTQHLGIPKGYFLIEPSYSCDTVKDGDRYLLCSDGLTD